MKPTPEQQAGNRALAIAEFPNWKEEMASGQVIHTEGMMAKAILFAGDDVNFTYHQDWNGLMRAGKKITDCINEDELKKESPEWLAYYSLETQLGLFNIKGVWSNLVTLANYLTK
jgi:hypothetical protein